MTERSPGEELTARQQTNGDANGLPKEFVEEWRDAAYNCFSSGHKFCREVCPVMQVTRNETPHARPRSTPTSSRWSRAHLDVADVAEDYVHCTQCGACELRCPNTLFTGDFYRFRTRTVDVVKAMRALAVEQRHPPAGAGSAGTSSPTSARNEPVLGRIPVDAGARAPTGRPTSTSRSAARRSSSSTARRRSTAPS